MLEIIFGHDYVCFAHLLVESKFEETSKNSLNFAIVTVDLFVTRPPSNLIF